MGLNRSIYKDSEITIPPLLENDFGINGFTMPLS